MDITIRRGTRGPTIRFFLFQEGENAQGMTGVATRTAGLQLAYLRDGDPMPTPISLTSWAAGVHKPGGFREIDAKMMPGLYEIQLPDEVCAAGASRATLMIQGPGFNPCVIHIDLVAYDPYDSYRLGLDCLSREARHDVISRAFREVVPEIVEEFRRKA